MRKQIIFFKPSGKFYTEGTYESNAHIWEPQFKEDIRNTQNAMAGEWWNDHDGWHVLTDDTDPRAEVGGAFQYHLWDAEDFKP